jgi:adenylate cyclase, class 1
LNFSMLQSNKKRYLAYNHFRKKIFSANSPKDSHVILYLLPWLLCVNRPSIPGYIKELKGTFHVSGVENDKEITKREFAFKKLFNIEEEQSMLNVQGRCPEIQGIYTIGSAGTVSQTQHSDCDIWICIDKKDFDDRALKYFRQKINWVKDWLDANLKIPVYFFISDIEDIRNCNFGALDCESSGSAQRNVLKEEFYRTSILIAGKIPFWWVCYNESAKVDYEREISANFRDEGQVHDFIDMGNLEEVNQDEYFGAAVWQFNKSLTHPLKSIIKMLQLKMFLEFPKEELLCHKLRRLVLSGTDKDDFPDPSVFAMDTVLDYYQNTSPEYYEYIKKLFYLRFDLKLLAGTQTLKEKMAGRIFDKHKMESGEIYILNQFESWRLHQHIHLGKLMFKFLLDIYKDIVRTQKGKAGKIAPRDLTILGRKLSSSLAHKDHKIPVIHIPGDAIKLPVLTFVPDRRTWKIYSSDDTALPVIASENIVYCIAYIVWNDIYEQAQTRMLPNQTHVTLQEIMNLARKIKDVFGSCDITGVHFSNFLQEEKITKILFIFSFEYIRINAEISDFCVIYKNNWEEMFVRRFSSLEKMKNYFMETGKISHNTEGFYYIQRTNVYYEKTIERAKNMTSQMLKNLKNAEEWPFF